MPQQYPLDWILTKLGMTYLEYNFTEKIAEDAEELRKARADRARKRRFESTWRKRERRIRRR